MSAAPRDEFGSSRMFPLLWSCTFVCVLITSAIPTDLSGQRWLAAFVLATLFIMRRYSLRDFGRVVFLMLGAYLTARYFFWRTFFTLTYFDFFSFAGAILLYLAEVFGISLYLLSIFINVQPLKRPIVPLPDDPAQLPTVDILVPSYNELPDMLEVTLLGALQVRYPKEKLRVYLLDDGGTVAKRNDRDPDIAATALARHEFLRMMCLRLGVQYLTREKNNNAKAGNINAALPHTHGELILILDADHVPTVDFLEKTVGGFVRDERLFLVQTPHFFINPDPIERQTQKIFGRMPSENEMFYSVIQHGLDFWSSSFFCGSAAILRRTHLESVGGISCATITEDAETSLDLHARGFTSAYIDRPMISGLQPETYTDFIAQRLRWAQGMVQIFVLKNPLLNRGLRWVQRIGYLSNSYFWFFGYARAAFLLAPAAYLLFGLRIYDANLQEVIAYTVPHVIGSMLVSQYLFGKVRWPFVAEMYEIMQSLFALPAIFRVLLNPRAPRFIVTPKGEQIDKDFVSTLSGPYYVVYGVTLLALAGGMFRYFNYPLEHDTLYITMAWEMVNLILLNAAIGTLLESRQRRARPRVDAELDGELLCDGRPPTPCRVFDLSNGGAQLVVSKSEFGDIAKNTSASLLVHNVALDKMTRLSLEVRNCRTLDDGSIVIGAMFQYPTQAEMAESVALVHGDSERWVRLLQRRDKQLGILQSFSTLLVLGTRYAFVHFRIIFEIVFGALAQNARQALHRLAFRERDRRDRRNRRRSMLTNVMDHLERRAAVIGK